MERTLSNRRRYLTANELEKLIKAGRNGRYGRRDATLMLLMARHGLRVTEAIDLRWDQIDFSKGHLHVRRLKGGIHSVHPIQGDELRGVARTQARAETGIRLRVHHRAWRAYDALKRRQDGRGCW